MDEGSRAVATTASLPRAASIIRAPNPRDAPVTNQVFMCLFLCSGEHLRELDQVSPWIGQEREPATDLRKFERLGDDGDASAAKLGDSLIDAVDVETEVMEAREAQAIAEILIYRFRNRARLAVTKQLNEERIIGRRREVSQLLIRIGRLAHAPEIQLLAVPALCGIEVRHSQGDVVALHRGEWTVFVASRNVDTGHDGAPFDERSEEHTSELQSRVNLVCRLLLEK